MTEPEAPVDTQAVLEDIGRRLLKVRAERAAANEATRKLKDAKLRLQAAEIDAEGEWRRAINASEIEPNLAHEFVVNGHRYVIVGDDVSCQLFPVKGQTDASA